jgi:SH3-like domain-containing protein
MLPAPFRVDEVVCESSSIVVQREFPSTMLESDYSFIASGIMHEIFNHFGYWRCRLFDEEGNYIREQFAKI